VSDENDSLEDTSRKRDDAPSETNTREPEGLALAEDESIDEVSPSDLKGRRKPLTPAEFKAALERVEALGLTWTADNIPQVRVKDSGTDDPLFTDEFTALMRKYPHLPAELSMVVAHAITGVRLPPGVGSAEDLREKAQIARKMVITPEYKSEFYFKHTTKVPYLTDIDWEVDLKVAERNVARPPGVSYALLSLFLSPPNIGSGPRGPRTVTVAVNGESVNRLIGILQEVEEALKIGAKMTANYDLKLKEIELKEG
jgi:hypothetical protein